MRIFTLFLLLGVITACDRNGGQNADSRQSADAAPTVAYTRRMVFVGGREAAPVVVAFDHLALAAPTAVARRAGLWRSNGDGWNEILDLGWTDEPIREPWRLIPHGPFRFLVDDAGEIEALTIRGAERFRLAPLGRIGTGSPDDLPYVRFLYGELVTGADSITGLLVDLQPATEGEDNGAASSELVLTDGTQFHLVVSTPVDRTGELWLQRAERAETMTGIVVARDDSAGADIWRLDSTLEEIKGELKVAGAPLELRYDDAVSGLIAVADSVRASSPARAADSVAAKAADAIPRPALLQVVRGWVEVRGERRNVFGVMRRAPA